MRPDYFPVALEELGADIRFHELVEGTLRVGDALVTTRYLIHPALTLGYRLQVDGATLVYVSDHGPHARELAAGRGRVEARTCGTPGSCAGPTSSSTTRSSRPRSTAKGPTGATAPASTPPGCPGWLAPVPWPCSTTTRGGATARSTGWCGRCGRACAARIRRCASSPPPKAKCSTSLEAVHRRRAGNPARGHVARRSSRRAAHPGSPEHGVGLIESGGVDVLDGERVADGEGDHGVAAALWRCCWSRCGATRRHGLAANGHAGEGRRLPAGDGWASRTARAPQRAAYLSTATADHTFSLADAQPSSPALAASSLRKAPASDVGSRSNSAARPTNSEGLLLLGQAAKSCLAAFGRTMP